MNTHHSFGLFVTFRLKFELVAPMVVVLNHGTLFTNCIAFLFSVFELSWFCCSNAGLKMGVGVDKNRVGSKSDCMMFFAMGSVVYSVVLLLL